MSDLVIKLTGEIEQSNFDEWKTDLTEKLKSVKTELVSDTDFADATKNVKAFKKAEKNLKEAKASALKQATDINQLFEAIDTVASETRKVRLSLEKQIKSRKGTIKKEAVAKAADKVRAVFKAQSGDFQLLGESEFTDLAIYEEAIKGTRGTKGMLKALDTVSTQMEEKITERAKVVKQNAATIDSLATGHQIAFQDRAFLLAKSPDELDAIIDERIDKLSKLASDGGAPAAADATEAEQDAQSESDTPGEGSDEPATEGAAEGDGDLYEITLHLRGSEEVVLKTMDEIKKTYRESPGFVEVTLKSVDS